MKKLALLASVCLLPIFAQVEPDANDPIRSRSFTGVGLQVQQMYRPLADLDPEVATQLQQDLQSRSLMSNMVQMDFRTGKIGTLLPSEPLIPGSGVGNDLTWEQVGVRSKYASQGTMQEVAWNRFLEYLQTNQSLLGIDIHELFGGETVTVHDGGDLIQIHAQRYVDGYFVRDSYVTAVISHGNLILMGIHGWSDVSTKNPLLDENQALNIVSDYLAGANILGFEQQPGLVYVPVARQVATDEVIYGDGYDYRLAWSIYPKFDRFAEYEGLVDAETGDLLAFKETTHYLSDHRGTGGVPKVIGGQLPISNDGVAPDGVEVEAPFPFLTVTAGADTYTTSSSGQIEACISGTWTIALIGPYIAITDNCGAVSESTTGLTLDLGMNAGTDCATPSGASAGNTRSARSAFYEINRSAEIARSHLPSNSWLQGQLPVNVNINQNCNATGGPSQLRFFTSGGGCANTGEIAGVFVHEWGHGMDGADATPGISSPGEGIADIYAALRMNDSCIGRNFRLGNNCGGYGDPCLDCDGVRDIDFANRQSGNPHDITFIDACGPGNSNGPCGASVHCEGSVYAESVWDLWKRDLPSLYGMGDKTAQELAYRLTFIGAGGVATWYQCVQGTGGCPGNSGYMNFLAADDDNGDLNDGTPHMQAIFDAFNRHGIACNTPTVQDSGCANTPTSAPTLMGVAQNRGAQLSWNAVANATEYRVFRTEGVFDCEMGSVWIATTTDLNYFDPGLLPGREYYYNVVPMGTSDSCLGPASSCVTVTAAEAVTFGITSNISPSFSNDDGDSFFDNCETGTFDIELFSIGSATNVQITDIQVDGLTVTPISSLPINVGTTTGVCSSSNASVSFEVEGMTPNSSIDVVLSLTSTESGPTTASFSIPIVEADLSAPQTITYDFEADEQGWSVQQGTFNRTNAIGGANSSSFYMQSSANLDGQCDQIRSPVFVPSASTTLELFTHFRIEAFGSGQWWDRANVGVYDVASNTRTHIVPSSGRAYNASGVGGTCILGSDPGWADIAASWATSSWDATAFMASSFDGSAVQLDLGYGTDGAANDDGFRFDQVTLTDVQLIIPQGTELCSACLSLVNDDWPAVSVLEFVDCINQSTRVHLAKSSKPTSRTQP